MSGKRMVVLFLLILVMEMMLFSDTDAIFWRRRRRRSRRSSSSPPPPPPPPRSSRCPLFDYKGSNFDPNGWYKFVRIENGFKQHAVNINRYAGDCGVKVYSRYTFFKHYLTDKQWCADNLKLKRPL